MEPDRNSEFERTDADPAPAQDLDFGSIDLPSNEPDAQVTAFPTLQTLSEAHTVKRTDDAPDQAPTQRFSQEDKNLFVPLIGFGLAALSCITFGLWFLIANLESPGLSWAIALVLISLVPALFGITKVSDQGLASEGKTAGWAALMFVAATFAYIFLFFNSWTVVAFGLLVLQLPMLFALLMTPTSKYT